MDNLYILDQSLNLLGVIDEYVSTIWTLSYSEIGDFEVYIGASDKAVELLQRNRYVVRSSDIEQDEDGNVTYKKVMIIKNIRLFTDVENGDFLTVTGRELKFILHSRIVWSQTVLTGTAEDAIRRLITENAISPTNPNRVIPGLALGVSAGFTETIEKQVTGDYLDEAISSIALTFGYGWDIFIYNSNLVFALYQGLDRSYNQSERPYVVFSEKFENLYNSEYVLDSEAYANMALVGGEGEGLARKYVTVNDELSGIERYETLIDADSIRSNDGEITESEYLKLLAEQGSEALASLGYTEAFTGEVLSDSTFTYGVDFDLGDSVTVINPYGIEKNVKVVGATETSDDSGLKLLPHFNT